MIGGGLAALMFGASMASAPEIAAAFLISMLGNIAVRDDGDRAKAVKPGQPCRSGIDGARHPYWWGSRRFEDCGGGSHRETTRVSS
jgi:hypothetical protein